MKQVIVDAAFWELFPEAQISILVLKDVDNHIVSAKQNDYQALLDTAIKKAEMFIEEEPFTQNRVIKDWREAFTKFKTKKGARSSIEALLKRVSQGRTFSPINPLVDLYNSISLSYGLPCGGEDIDHIVGDMHLGLAKGGESFFPLGAEDDAPALEGEVYYFDEEGAICRNFNWREAQRTMLTEETSQAVLVLEAITDEQKARALEASQALQELLAEWLGVTAQIYHLTADQSSCPLG